MKTITLGVSGWVAFADDEVEVDEIIEVEAIEYEKQVDVDEFKGTGEYYYDKDEAIAEAKYQVARRCGLDMRAIDDYEFEFEER